MKTTTAQDFIADLDFGDLFDIMHFDGGYRSDKAQEYVEAAALKAGVTITDEENIDAQAYNAYQCSEKGLS